MSTNFPISVCCNSRCSCESLKRCLTEEKVWPNCHKHPRSCITLAEKSCFEEPEPFASLHLVVIRLEAYLSHPHREGGMRSRECVPPISPRHPGNLQIGRACEIFADSLQNLWFSWSQRLRENHQRAFYNMQSRFCDQDPPGGC